MSQANADKVVVAMSIGHSGQDDATRRIHESIVKRGFVEWHKWFYGPLLEKGLRRFERHLPFGARAKGPMDFCGWWELDRRDIKGVESDAWTDGTDWLYRQGAFPIDYYGAAAEDPEMRVLIGARDVWTQRAMSTVKPSMGAGAGIGFDAVADLPDTHYVFDLMDQLADQAVPVYGEAWPHRDTTRAHRFGVWCKHWVWEGAMSGKHAGRAKPDQIGGEVLVACGADMNHVRQVIDAGHTPMIGPGGVEAYLKEFG